MTQSCNALQVIPCQVGFGTVPGHGLEPSKPALTVKTALTVKRAEPWIAGPPKPKVMFHQGLLALSCKKIDFAISFTVLVREGSTTLRSKP